MDTIHGFRDGDRVRDRRDGFTGTVRFNNLSAEERASGEYAEAEVRWDGRFGDDELELVLPHLKRICSTGSEEENAC
ncbi:hypothetical protein GCM10012275_53200 [Longimycelium tulufanense]|uniref:Uncharacterized protein n=1 Tax=Longimycelium tulufanense TaxID=907463 RepID=A0A8J3CJB8_9PSEU|nr:hypothetical protein [Longimycelium tulufanense]GGM75818.1 hypothetical protein GCM10012275_53200 [Longimycelium tulufanense]